MTPVVFTEGKKEKTLTGKLTVMENGKNSLLFSKQMLSGSSKISRIRDGGAFVALFPLWPARRQDAF